jgi:hypothetical protein
MKTPATGRVAAVTLGGRKAGSIAAIWKAARRAVTNRENQPRPRTRRRKEKDETGRAAFIKAANTVLQLRLPRTYAAAVFLSQTLDWLHLWHQDATPSSSGPGSAFNTQQNYLSPHL